MKSRFEVSAEKLRGGFYTPPRLVAHAVEQLERLLGSAQGVRLLEPSIGDGAFLDGLASSQLAITELVGVEILESEARKASQRLQGAGIPGRVINESTLKWSLRSADRSFDGVVGNLPFVRFQFVSAEDRMNAARHGNDLGVGLGGVSNLWLPMLLAAVRQLRDGGAFVLVLPAECLTGVSAGSAREWLLQNIEELRCDLYPAGSFPGALQEVVLLSGRKSDSGHGTGLLTVALHSRLHSDENFTDSSAITTVHRLAGRASWTRCLLAPAHLDAFAEFENLPAVSMLSAMAKFEVATVTGANAFFSLTSAQVEEYDLADWARPLLPRTRYAPGLVFSAEDYEEARASGIPAFIFDASLAPTERAAHAGLDRFLSVGEAQELQHRFKCRIREPWWAVPGIRQGALLLSKRCHRYPRMIVNETDAITTDTIYRGRMVTPDVSPHALVAGFHNSGTLLSAELEGRNFGGGVLELVPSEVSRLQVPYSSSLADEMGRLDALSREQSAHGEVWRDVLRHETDLVIRKAGIGVTGTMLDALAGARELLMERRLDRAGAERA